MEIRKRAYLLVETNKCRIAKMFSCTVSVTLVTFNGSFNIFCDILQ
jgi:hypothetical protein